MDNRARPPWGGRATVRASIVLAACGPAPALAVSWETPGLLTWVLRL